MARLSWPVSTRDDDRAQNWLAVASSCVNHTVASQYDDDDDDDDDNDDDQSMKLVFAHSYSLERNSHECANEDTLWQTVQFLA